MAKTKKEVTVDKVVDTKDSVEAVITPNKTTFTEDELNALIPAETRDIIQDAFYTFDDYKEIQARFKDLCLASDLMRDQLDDMSRTLVNNPIKSLFILLDSQLAIFRDTLSRADDVMIAEANKELLSALDALDISETHKEYIKLIWRSMHCGNIPYYNDKVDDIDMD